MRRTSLRRQHAWVLTGLLLVAVLAVTGLGLAVRANAQTSFSVESIGGQIGLGDADLRQVVLNVIRWVLSILTLTGVVYMMYGGYLWLTAAGNEKRVEKAKQVILQAAIGLVIVLLAWAIVFFVARSIANVTNQHGNNPGNGGEPCNPLVEDCGEVTTFDVTNIASCSTGDPNTSVPRSSAIQLTFNTNVKAGAVQQAVADDLTNANPPNLIIQKCASNDCTNLANLSTPIPLENQRYTPGTEPTRTGTPQADWVQNNKVVTFYHVATDTVAAEARFFEPNQKYLLTIPAKNANKALLDVRDRKLDNCRQQSSSIEPLPGCSTTASDRITWEFTTGSDADGPALNIASAFPSFGYQTSTVSPNRSVAQSSFLSVQFNGAIDFNTLTTTSFKVYKCGTGNIPTAANDWNECDDETNNQVPVSNFIVEPRPDGRGGILRPVAPFRYDAFTWYKVEVSGVRNLCGRVQEPSSKVWVFQTNDTVPGVKKVYPRDGVQNACPATKVFIQYATSMWDGSSFDCNVGGGSYVSRGLLTPNPGRNFIPSSVFDPNDPNTCSMYEFTPTTTLLPPSTSFEARVESDLVIDSNGKKLNYGYAVAGDTTEGPWSFQTATANTCAQEPVIIKVSPGQGPDGQCLSVIGDYFEKVNYPDVNTDAPDTGDSLTLRAINQTADTWTNDYIVSSVAAGTLTKNASHPYVVTVNYPAPIGPLSSAPENFFLTDDSVSVGPCLTKISPTSGLVNTTVTAKGKRLGTGGEVHYSTKTPPTWTVAGPWNDTTIENINVDTGSPAGRGSVTAVVGGQESNALPYTVKTTTNSGTSGTPPAIEETTVCSRTKTPSPNPRRDELAACINAWPSVRFTVEVDPATLDTGTVVFEQCDAAYTSCTVVSGYAVVPFPNYRGVKINPGRSLTPSTAYRITVRNVESADHLPMVTPYQWRFTTKAGNAPCPIDQVVIQQSDRVFRDPFHLGLPTEVMDRVCNTVDGSSLTYSWSNSASTICALQAGYTGPMNVCRSPDPINEGETLVQVTIPSEGISSNQVRITANQVACETSLQCACGSNTTSQCVGGRCSPVVTSMTPDNGRVGTWATVQGCWFGKYVDTKSKVIFSDNKEGLVPASTTAACTAANTWSNTQIVREVPKLETPTNDTSNDAVTGPIQVIRSDAAIATGPTFTINAEEYPKICRIDPVSRFPTEVTTVYGKDLGDDQGTGDNVKISDDDTATVTPFTAYPQWDTDRIGTVVPTPAAGADVFGQGQVRVTHVGKVSNPLIMTLKNPGDVQPGVGTCAAADQCVFGDDSTCGPGRGCGFSHCCAARPVVTGTRPVVNETDICRNTQIQVDFSQPLLSSTVTPTTVHYFNGPQVVNGKISLLNGGTTIAYEPGLLSANMDQRMSLVQTTSTPITVVNPSFETADTGQQPTGWTNNAYAKQSSERPSGSGSFSVLVDCSTNPCSQAYTTQDLETASTTIRGYHVTGWVKADIGPGSLGGFITQCYGSGSSSCVRVNRAKTYDRWGDAPGLFDNTTGSNRLTSDWKKVDFVVVNPTALNIGVRVNCFANPGSKVWCDDIQVNRITEQSSLLRGASGVVADVRLHQQAGTDPFNLTFTTSAAICALDRVVVMPASKYLTASGQIFTPAPVAQAYSGRRTAPLSEVPGVYEWSWRWERVGGSDAIATVQNQDNPSTIVTARTTPGKITAQATAKVTVDNNNNATLNKEVSGQTNVTVDFCATPWTFTDQATNCTANPNPGSTAEDQCPSLHFRLYYCAGPAQPLLNHQAIEGRNRVDPDRKKSFFFKETETSQDAIGMLIYANPDLLSPYDWYRAHFTNQVGSSTTIGGYPALRTGTTAVIGVTDLTDANQLTGYIVVMDFNSNNASATTQAIYNSILSSIEFNATQPLSVADREAIVSDTQRVQDLRSIKTLLEGYKTTNGRYPDLPAGSYIPGFSTSAWPSWQGELANALGRTLPTDPTNGFTPGVCQSPYEAASCWDQTNKKFQCPVGSQIYSYKTVSGGASYELFANLKYAGIGGLNNYNGNPCTGLGTNTTCACFNYRLSTP